MATAPMESKTTPQPIASTLVPSIKLSPLALSPIKITPLANPKRVKHHCEICSKPAYVTCPECRLTYYCNEDHFLLDREAIHAKICHLIKQLRTPGSLFGSEEERKAKEQKLLELRKTLLNITRTDSQKLLFEGQFSHAIPAALQALRCTVIISGTQSPELVPCYLLLGEASIGLKDYEQAESYLASAEWALQKTPNTQIQAKLFHHFGLLYFSKEKYTAALNALTQSLYLASPWMHPLDIRMSGTFFQLGRVFQAQKEPLKATSAFLQVTESWLRYFQETSSVRDVLDAAQTAEAHVMFHQMTDFFHESPALLMKVKAVYALFLKSLGHTEEAMVTFQVALKLAMAPHSHGFYDWKGVFPWIARVFDGQSQNLTSFPPQLDDTTTHFPSDEALIPSKNMIPPNLEGNNVFAK